jgi:D-arabinose 1-dehydrogenase-like Zn-dependent alcohol dehydrogenase
MQLKPLLTERWPLEAIDEAIVRMRDGSLAGRCLIDMSGGA